MTYIWGCCHICLLMSSKYEQINYFLLPMKLLKETEVKEFAELHLKLEVKFSNDC